MDKSADEVQKHYKQAVHNYKFFCEVHSKLPDAFFDWKITVLFYTTTHLLRALMAEKEIDVGPSHPALKKAINPKNRQSKYPVKPHCYNSYKVLYNAADNARYSGFIDSSKRDSYLKSRFNQCEKAIQSVDGYMKSQGYNSLMPLQKEFEFEENN